MLWLQAVPTPGQAQGSVYSDDARSFLFNYLQKLRVLGGQTPGKNTSSIVEPCIGGWLSATAG